MDTLLSWGKWRVVICPYSQQLISQVVKHNKLHVYVHHMYPVHDEARLNLVSTESQRQALNPHADTVRV